MTKIFLSLILFPKLKFLFTKVKHPKKSLDRHAECAIGMSHYANKNSMMIFVNFSMMMLLSTQIEIIARDIFD